MLPLCSVLSEVCGLWTVVPDATDGSIVGSMLHSGLQCGTWISCRACPGPGAGGGCAGRAARLSMRVIEHGYVSTAPRLGGSHLMHQRPP